MVGAVKSVRGARRDMYLLRFCGWSDEFNLFRINHKPSPIFAGAVEIGSRATTRVSEAGTSEAARPKEERRLRRQIAGYEKERKVERKKSKRKKEMRNEKEETVADGESGCGRDGTAGWR